MLPSFFLPFVSNIFFFLLFSLYTFYVLHLFPHWPWDKPNLLSSVNRDIFPWGKLRAIEAEHGIPSPGQVKNEWSYTSNCTYVVMAWRGKASPSNLPLSLPFAPMDSISLLCSSFIHKMMARLSVYWIKYRGMEALGKVEVQLHSILTLALDEIRDHLESPAVLPAEKR